MRFHNRAIKQFRSHSEAFPVELGQPCAELPVTALRPMVNPALSATLPHIAFRGVSSIGFWAFSRRSAAISANRWNAPGKAICASS